MEYDYIECGNCYELIKQIPDKSIDLIVTDPPYLIENTQTGTDSELNRSFQKVNDEIEEANLVKGYDMSILNEFMRIMKKPNIYIWCNHKQIPMYLEFFVNKHQCKFDIIIWNKSNAVPTFNNKYMTDKEYCLYFRKGGYCNPSNYEDAKTVYYQPINAKDKKLYKHPTIKPLNIIETIIKNSSKENDIILDPFLGSGTTAVCAKKLNRKYIGFEIDPDYFEIIQSRLDENYVSKNKTRNLFKRKRLI